MLGIGKEAEAINANFIGLKFSYFCLFFAERGF